MSGPLHAWYSLHDLESLAGRHGELGGELELDKLPRLAGLLQSADGSVRASLRFRQRGEGGLAVTLEYETTVLLLCQRCLEPYHERLANRVEMALVDEGADEASLPEGLEPVEMDNGRLLPVGLVEDELIVSIPLVPKHAKVEDCGSLADDLANLTEGSAAARATDL
nr:putative ACR, COG1399 [uncultured bacterium]